jgi:hypothetical protein
MNNFLLVLLLILTAVISFYCQRKFGLRGDFTYKEKSFIWMFFQGWLSVYLGSVGAFVYASELYSSVHSGHFSGDFVYVIWLISCLLYGVCGLVLIIHKSRIAWILITLFTFNPILWIINYYYGSKRWDLMGR